jgi:hypothetical protein
MVACRLALIRSGRPFADDGCLMARPRTRTPESHPAPGRPAGRGPDVGTDPFRGSKPSGIRNEPARGVGIEANSCGERSQFRRRAPDRSQFHGGTKPISGGGRRIKPNFLSERTHLGALATDRSQFPCGSNPIPRPGDGSNPIPRRIEANFRRRNGPIGPGGAGDSRGAGAYWREGRASVFPRSGCSHHLDTLHESRRPAHGW